MSRIEENVNETIVNMITNLKPKIAFEFGNTSYKRSLSLLSDNSTSEDQTPKKQKFNNSVISNYLGSPREIRRLRADLVEARNTILTLENRIKHMHNVRKEMQLMFDNETLSLRQQREYDKKSIEELESQLQTIRLREHELKQKLTVVTSKYEQLQETHQERVDELEKYIDELKTESKYQEQEDNSAIVGLKRKVSELEALLETSQEDAQVHKNLSVELEKRLAEKNVIEREMDMKHQALQKALLQIKELKYEKESYLESVQQVKAQQYKLAKYSDFEKEIQTLRDENVRLKDEVRNKLLLEEEVYDLKNRLAKYKEQEAKLGALQVAHAQAELNLEEWRTVARGICENNGSESSLPHLLRQIVERLQQQEINLTSEKVQLDSQLNAALHEVKLARSQLEKTQKHLIESQNNLRQRQDLIHRMQKKLLLVTRERDSYRLQLDSYEKDLTICLNPGQQAGGNQQQTQRERIENLERIVEGYRDMVNKLEADLQNVEHSGQTETIPVRAEQYTRLQQELDQLKSENEWLRSRRDQLEVQLERYVTGEDKMEGRILHVTNNPVSEYVEERENKMEKLQEEVERLKRKIKNMEEGLEGSKISDMSLCPKEALVLKEQIKTAETQNQRLKDYFKSSMQEFRNVIYMLLGYKVDKTSNSQYKLTSMYADSPEDQICFQLNPQGALDLLENHFSATLEDMVDLHLRHQKSIPVFLSAITMDLFNNRTMSSKTFEVD